MEGRDGAVLNCDACGKYFLDIMAMTAVQHSMSDSRHLLSAATRTASDAGKPSFVEASNLELLVASVRPRAFLFDMIDRALLLAGERSKEYWEPFRIDVGTDWPLISARGEKELNYLLQRADERQLIHAKSSQISADGWRRIEELRSNQPSGRQAFVAMWFDASMNETWLHGFKAGIEDTQQYDAFRVDEAQYNDKIDDRIVAEIRRSSLLVADFTGSRGGVYFEAGLAMGLGIPVIWTCRSDEIKDVHFDTRQYNHVVWDTAADLREKLNFRLLATVAHKPSNRNV